MLPTYIAVVVLSVLALLRWRRKGYERASSPWQEVLGLLIFILIVLPVVAFPIPNLQEPSGRYPVGTKTFFLQDESREEIYTDGPTVVRELNVQIWYPSAKDSHGPSAAYLYDLDPAGRAFANFLGLPAFVLNHVNLVETHSKLEVPVAAVGGKHPQLVFSHG